MKSYKIKCLFSVILILFCVILNSCKISENPLKGSSEVDFSTPQKVQINFNDHIYDAIIVLRDSRLEVKFINEKDLLEGAYACLTNDSYKITYKDMVFNGDISELNPSSLLCVLNKFFHSFENKIILDLYNNNRQCYYIKKTVSGCFVTLECYEHSGNKAYSIEIK